MGPCRGGDLLSIRRDSDTDCYKLEVMGNSATFTDKDGTGSRYEILKGNPKGL